MCRIWTALFLFFATVIFAIAGCLGIIPALFSCISFAAPGARANPFAWLFFLTVGSFPFVCFYSIAREWVCYIKRKHLWASLIALLPLVNVLVFSVMLTVSGNLGQITELMGDVAADHFGTPYQRLKWKAEKFFTDQNVVALCKAIEAKDINEIDRLAKTGVNINAKGRGNMTPLLWSFPMGEDVFVKMLDLGADPNVQLTENMMPRNRFALIKGKSVMSASVTLTNSFFRDHIARNVNMDNYLEQVIKHGGNVHLEDTKGNTPIFSASYPERCKEKIQLLLDAGADINHRNREGDTPLLAARWLAYDFKLALLEAGADYRIPNARGWDIVLDIERNKMQSQQQGMAVSEREQPIIDWLTRDGVNWKAAHKALLDNELRNTLKNLPGNYEHRPWLPQRPNLKNAM